MKEISKTNVAQKEFVHRAEKCTWKISELKTGRKGGEGKNLNNQNKSVMKSKQLKIARDLSISAVKYAIQANAILGIRESGKTYTAMKLAEELLDNKIPIIVYDPANVWKNIRTGIKGRKGYPVIVAGGAGSGADILLTEHNAVDIVRAAVMAGVSLILDLFHEDYSKAAWGRIVQSTSHWLFYNNQNYGLRHIFYEEANEFIPQNPMPQQRIVLSSVEKIARMGRNSSLGCTFINQRSQEIAKSVFELCALVFMHKQTGTNSLKAVKSWMEAKGVKEGNKEVVHKLSGLQAGESFVMDSNTNEDFKKIKTLPKKTFHPSPELGVAPKMAKSTVNISTFVKKLNTQLDKQNKEKEKEIKTKVIKPDGIPKGYSHLVKQGVYEGHNEKTKRLAQQLNEGNAKLNIAFATEKEHLHIISKITKHNEELKKQLTTAISERENVLNHLKIVQMAGVKLYNELEKMGTNKFKSLVKVPADLQLTLPVSNTGKGNSVSTKGLPAKIAMDGLVKQSKGNSKSENGLSACANKFLQTMCMYYPNAISRERLSLLSGYRQSSSTFANGLTELRKREFMTDNSMTVAATEEGYNNVGQYDKIPTDPETIKGFWLNKLSKVAGTFLNILFNNYPGEVSREFLSEKSGYLITSSTFANGLTELRKLGLVQDLADKSLKAHEDIFNN